MIKSPDKVRDMEASYDRSLYRTMDYEEALERFEALWMEALLLNPRIGRLWEEDIEPDIVLARILNGLPPEA